MVQLDAHVRRPIHPNLPPKAVLLRRLPLLLRTIIHPLRPIPGHKGNCRPNPRQHPRKQHLTLPCVEHDPHHEVYPENGRTDYESGVVHGYPRILRHQRRRQPRRCPDPPEGRKKIAVGTEKRRSKALVIPLRERHETRDVGDVLFRANMVRRVRLHWQLLVVPHPGPRQGVVVTGEHADPAGALLRPIALRQSISCGGRESYFVSTVVFDRRPPFQRILVGL